MYYKYFLNCHFIGYTNVSIIAIPNKNKPVLFYSAPSSLYFDNHSGNSESAHIETERPWKERQFHNALKEDVFY